MSLATVSVCTWCRRFPRVSGDEPAWGGAAVNIDTFPRVSGDEPAPTMPVPSCPGFSPRERG